MAGPDVAELGPAGDEGQGVGALVGRAVVGQDRQRLDLARLWIEAVGEERIALSGACPVEISTPTQR
jgi:hypothetical protein